MKRYRLEMLGVSEAKIRGNGEKMIGDVQCVYFGGARRKSTSRCGSSPVRKFGYCTCLREWKCVSERIVRVRLKVEGVWLTVVQVYAPTEDSNKEVKADFFTRLQETIGGVNRGDVLVVMGDLNARVGNDTKVWREVLERHGEAVCNDNGGRLV